MSRSTGYGVKLASALSLACILLFGCASGPGYYAPRGASASPASGSSLAVVCGWADALSRHYAARVQGRLRDQSRFAVSSDADIRIGYPEYPVNVLRSPKNVDDKDVANLARIGATLGVDYVMATWVYGIETTVDSSPISTTECFFMAVFVDVRSRSLAGLSAFSSREGSGTDVNDGLYPRMIENAATTFTGTFLKATGMAISG